jgi:hypothetical protein
MTAPVLPDSDSSEGLRKLAIEQLRKKRGLQAHVIAYVSVNLLLVAIWYSTGAHFFWPVFPMFGWGIGLAFNIWDVYMPERMTEDRIQREMQRLNHQR